jgi:hypothetical protein
VSSGCKLAEPFAEPLGADPTEELGGDLPLHSRHDVRMHPAMLSVLLLPVLGANLGSLSLNHLVPIL